MGFLQYYRIGPIFPSSISSLLLSICSSFPGCGSPPHATSCRFNFFWFLREVFPPSFLCQKEIEVFLERAVAVLVYSSLAFYYACLVPPGLLLLLVFTFLRWWKLDPLEHTLVLSFPSKHAQETYLASLLKSFSLRADLSFSQLSFRGLV